MSIKKEQIIPKYDRNPDYFEGVLQLRNITPELEAFVHNSLSREHVRIAKAIPQPLGIDLYVSSNKFILKLAKKLKETFSGELKISSRLFTKNRQTSKNVYRMSVFFKQTLFHRGDCITIRGNTVKILSIGNKIRAQDIKTGKKYEYSFLDMEKVENHF